ncbi:MAG TPA: sodium ion-translocating decarboxylase subunit beta, partial [bacterium]|nr:sodium ion-translocating decarboxylase subunit beta [bacterium]
MNILKKSVFLLTILLSGFVLSAMDGVAENFTGVYENKALVKLNVRYFVAGQWKERTEFGAIVSDNYSTEKDKKEPGSYLVITGQRAVLPDSDEIDMFIPADNNYEVIATFSDGVQKTFSHQDVIVADNGVSFINHRSDPGRYPVMISGESVGDVVVNNSIYIKNFQSTYQITPLFVDFSLRSSSPLEEYVLKNKSFITKFFNTTAFAHISLGNIIMMLVAFIFIFLAIAKDYEPLLLLPIGFGILIGNIPT